MHPGGERLGESKIFCPERLHNDPGLEPRLLDLEYSVPTIMDAIPLTTEMIKKYAKHTHAFFFFYIVGLTC